MSHEQIFQETAEWIFKIQQAPLSSSEQLQLEQWKNRSSQHQAAWSKAERLLQSLDGVPKDGQIPIKPDNTDAEVNLTKNLLLVIFLFFCSAVAWNSDYKAYLFSDYSTAIGQKKKVELTDGTIVQLNTNTAFDVCYSAEQRTIWLHYGEIQVHTAKEKSHAGRPFFVETESAQLQALGTVFNVQSLQNQENQTCLGVLENAVKVKLDQSGQTKVIRAGERLCFDAQKFQPLHALDPNM